MSVLCKSLPWSSENEVKLVGLFGSHLLCTTVQLPVGLIHKMITSLWPEAPYVPQNHGLSLAACSWSDRPFVGSGLVYPGCVFHSLVCSKSWWVGVEVQREQRSHQHQEATVVTEGVPRREQTWTASLKKSWSVELQRCSWGDGQES